MRLAPVQMTHLASCRGGLRGVHLPTGPPSAPSSSFSRVPTLLGARPLYDAAGRVAEAEVTYRKAIQLRASDWAAYNSLGVSTTASA